LSSPLKGKRVLVTRAQHQAGKLSEELRALGAEPVEVAVLEIRPPASFEPLDAALRQLESYDWLILTSANTVRALAERAEILGISLKQPVSPKAEPSQLPRIISGAGRPKELAPPQVAQVAAVGEATASAARKVGFQIAFVPESYVAESLLAGLLDAVENRASGKRILLARAVVARDVIPDALRTAGAEVDVVDAYRNVLPDAAPELLRRSLVEGIDAATFTSSSSATHLAEAARAAGIVWPFAGVAAVSIGPITSQTLRELGWEPAVEANPFDIPGLIAAVVKVLCSQAAKAE
jgi:uroporphyrinogen-III synthase/uroporphyrinogen III methyltransferase/synthase